MAKSKSGGTRSYLRGKIGADVYSIGRDGKGAKQQVVRSLAEVVSNPQTTAQMRGRMIMSTVMQCVAAMSQIVDHSFDNVPNGQPSISEFIRRNYALVKADIAAHPSSGNYFRLNRYQQKGALYGPYVMAQGSAVRPSEISAYQGGNVVITLPTDNVTIGALKTIFGGDGSDYMTICLLANDTFSFTRLKVNTALEDTTTITAENVATAFLQEGNDAVTISINDNRISFTNEAMQTSVCGTIIMSVYENGAWIHNDAVMSAPSIGEDYADEVLPTYPTGTARFLNGGEI